MEEEQIIQAIPDSLQADSVAAVSDAGSRLLYGISLQKPEALQTVYAEPAGNAMSWIVAILVVLFVVAALRYRKNAGYFLSVFHNVVERRERSSYDSTVRETSFILILNLLWCVSMGILLYALVARSAFHSPVQIWNSLNIGAASLCAAVAVIYTLFLIVAYQTVGLVFSDARSTSEWVSGYLSSQAMAGVVLFPLAIIGFAVPSSLLVMLIIGGIAFIVSKLIFFYRGFCIFFGQNGSWVLFLYYLCSLEIVPMVLAFKIAAKWTAH